MRTLLHQYKLSEEVVRWAFEVHLREHPVARANWFVAFTNPTAGPWKRLTAEDSTGAAVEILRFGREEDRPDLVLVNDSLKVVLIVEAKDQIDKLVACAQMKKSLAVIATLENRLARSDVAIWRERKMYAHVAAFLWPTYGTGDLDQLRVACETEAKGTRFIALMATDGPEGVSFSPGASSLAPQQAEEIVESLGL